MLEILLFEPIGAPRIFRYSMTENLRIRVPGSL